MKKYLRWLWMLMLPLLNACPSSQWEFTKDPVSKNFEEIHHQIVNRRGAEIKVEELELSIPEHALSSEQEIIIYKSDTEKPLGNNTASSVYMITGLRGPFEKDIRLSLDHTGIIEGDTLLALGMPLYNRDLDTIRMSYVPVDATYENGKISITLSGNRPKLKSAPVNRDKVPTGIFSNLGIAKTKNILSKKTESKRFKILFDKGITTDRKEKLITILEGNYNYLTKTNFDFSGRDWQYPLKVYIRDLSASDNLGAYWYDPNETGQLDYSINTGYLEIDDDILTDIQELQSTISHEFLHFVHDLYGMTYEETSLSDVWLQEASAEWYGPFMTGDPEYTSGLYASNILAPFEGWQSDNADNGYSLSFIFKELYNQTQSINALKSVFDDYKSNADNESPVTILADNLPGIASEFWHKAMKKLIRGDYFHGEYNYELLNYLFENKLGSTLSKEGMSIPFNKLNNFSAGYSLAGITDETLSGLPGNDTGLLKFLIPKDEECGLLVYSFQTLNAIKLIGEIAPGVETELTISHLTELKDHFLLMIYTCGKNNGKAKGKHSGWIDCSVVSTTDENDNSGEGNEGEGDIYVMEGDYNITFDFDRFTISSSLFPQTGNQTENEQHNGYILMEPVKWSGKNFSCTYTYNSEKFVSGFGTTKSNYQCELNGQVYLNENNKPAVTFGINHTLESYYEPQIQGLPKSHFKEHYEFEINNVQLDETYYLYNSSLPYLEEYVQFSIPDIDELKEKYTRYIYLKQTFAEDGSLENESTEYPPPSVGFYFTFRFDYLKNSVWYE